MARTRKTVHANLRCPECKSGRMSVRDTRAIGDTIKRRRSCDDCDFRITTFEVTGTDLALINAWEKRIGDLRLLMATAINDLDAIATGAQREATKQYRMADLFYRADGNIKTDRAAR